MDLVFSYIDTNVMNSALNFSNSAWTTETMYGTSPKQNHEINLDKRNKVPDNLICHFQKKSQY